MRKIAQICFLDEILNDQSIWQLINVGKVAKWYEWKIPSIPQDSLEDKVVSVPEITLIAVKL